MMMAIILFMTKLKEKALKGKTASVRKKICCIFMNTLHNRLKVELGRKNGIFTTARRIILKLLGWQSLVAKYCKIQKIQPCEVCKYCIYFY